MSISPVSRRALLGTLGLLGGSGMVPGLSLLPSLRPRKAQAAAAPVRLGIFYTYFGTFPEFWVPKTGTESSFDLHGILEPLKPHAKDIVLLDGLDMKSRELSQNPGNAHQQGQNQALACTAPISAELAGGASLDQVVAQAWQGKTRFPSLEFGVNDGLNFPDYHSIAYSGPGQRLPSEPNPGKIWDRIFKGFDPGGLPSRVPDAAKLRKKSILDYALAEIDAAQPKLSMADRQKLSAHAASIRDLEIRLALANLDAAAPGVPAACVVPTRSVPLQFDGIADLQARLLAMSWGCDLTRVATYNVEELNGRVTGISGDVHGLDHDTSPDNGSLRNDRNAVLSMKRYFDKTAMVFKGLVDRLAEIPDFDGQRVLDNSVVLWCGEIALGSHSYYDLKWVTAGKAGGALQTGRWLKFARPGGKGPPHNNLFVSLANAVGVPITKFGNAACTGKLERL